MAKDNEKQQENAKSQVDDKSPSEQPSKPPSKAQRPSVGRIVHYQIEDAEAAPHAAIIQEVDEKGTVTLGIFMEGVRVKRGVPYADSPTPGHWNWPPRV